MSIWWRDHADHHMGVLLSADGPFKGCKPVSGATKQTSSKLSLVIRLPMGSFKPAAGSIPCNELRLLSRDPRHTFVVA
ncbi:hypothetical protein AHiyo4_21060 [Arthrobacter sp. Hiyo4]|nr:hypothetical protein AHiyo4_21060 [Arthrobacter sp. Hiyo4]